MSTNNASHGHQNKHGFKRQDFLSLLITFIIGVVAGGYLYMTGFAPQFEELTGQTEAVYDDLVVVGEVYGGDRLGSSPSFQVLNDGTFRYLPSIVASEEVQAKEGTIPKTLLASLKKELTPNDLNKAEQTTAADNCLSYVDGLDYRYTITLDTVSYELDSCGTQFSVDSALGGALDSLWNYFETLP